MSVDRVPSPTQVTSPWAHIADELADAARRGNELCNRLRAEFRPIQAEAYTSYCEREALVEATEAERQR